MSDSSRDLFEKWRAAFTNRDEKAFLSLYSPSVTLEEPAGAPIEHGKEPFAKSMRDDVEFGETEILDPPFFFTGGREISFATVARRTNRNDGHVQEFPFIETWGLNDEGLIAHVKVFMPSF